MVASKDEIAAAMAAMRPLTNTGAGRTGLEIPSSIDANVTQVVSEAELRAEMERSVRPIIRLSMFRDPRPDRTGAAKINEPSLTRRRLRTGSAPSPFSGGGDAEPVDILLQRRRVRRSHRRLENQSSFNGAFDTI